MPTPQCLENPPDEISRQKYREEGGDSRYKARNRVFKFASSDSVRFSVQLTQMDVNFPHKPRRNDL